MNRSDKIEQVSASLFAVHRDLINPKKDSRANAGKFSYTYLSLPALIEHLRPKLKDAQLYVTQEVLGGQGFVEITTTVWHLSGQYIEFGPTFMPATGDAQQVGSATTYARRYALAAVFNLAADEDDDAAKTKTSEGTTARTAMTSGAQAAPRVAAPSDNGAEASEEGGAAPNAGGGTASQDVDPIPALSFITREQFEDYAQALGGKTELLRAARKKYGDKILSWKDITQSQADALLVQGG